MLDRVSALVSLLAELRRRKVVHTGLVYLAGAFITLQSTDVVVRTYDLPDVVQALTGLVVAAGLPVTLTLAWMFDWTADGLQRAEHASLPRRLRGLLYGTSAGVLCLAALAAAMAVFGPSVRAPAAPPESRTIAMLPFREIGGAGDGWLAAALEARLEEALAGLPALSLRATAAVVPYHARGVPLDSLARVLGIDFFVSASLTALPDGTTVTLQLIDGRTGTLIVSETLRHAHVAPSLAAVDAVAGAVERVLRPELGRELRLRRLRTETPNGEAYVLRHRAQERLWAAETMLYETPAGADLAFAAADSLLERAHRRSPDWIEPLVARAALAERRALSAWYAHRDPERIRPLLDRGIAYADSALRARPESAEALTRRGRLRWRCRAWCDADPEEGRRLTDTAEADLRAALAIDPGIASAEAALSELLFIARADYREARRHGLNALRLDAYLDDTSLTINRIALASHELGEDEEATRWCRLGMQRFPERALHHACALEVMAWGLGPAEPDSAWALHGRLAGRGASESALASYRYAVAAVLARAGVPADSIEHVLAAVRRTVDARGADPAYLPWEAAVRFRMGMPAEAWRLLAAFRRSSPARFVEAAQRRTLRPYIGGRAG
jgi:TolB-like protein/tetratricopeptide (TPR) repeat protein